MRELTLGQLAQWCGGSVEDNQLQIPVTGLQHDSRNVQPGDLFVALPGERVDGHSFVNKALAAGAVAALVDHRVETALPQIVVEDTMKAYGDIARAYRIQSDVQVVAVTGSVGKTTTKEMIACVLSGGCRVAKTSGNHNNQLGLPMTIMEMPADTEKAVLELGMNHFGEMSYLTSIACPDIAVITNIGTMHIEHLGSREGILKAKLEILEGLQEGGTAVFNGDEPLLWNMAKDAGKRIYFGIENQECDLIAEEIRQMDGGISFKATGLGKSFHVYVPQEGRHTVYNALAAIAVGRLCGIGSESMQYQLGLFHNTGMRQRVFEKNGFTIIEDCYNAGPESMEAALRVLSEHKTEGRRIAVLGDMLELGSRSMAEHYRVGRLAAECSDMTLAYGEHSERIVTGAVTGGIGIKCALHYDDQQTMAHSLAGLAKPGDVLLFKGSRGMKMEEVLRIFLEETKK